MQEFAIQIVAAEPADAGEILSLQKLAYESEARLYDDWSIAPLMQDVTHLAQQIRSETVLKAVAQTQIVGSVRALEQNGTCSIGRLIVLPSLQRRGIGSRLMAAIEASFPRAALFELFTGHLSRTNLELYARLGYRTVRTQEVSAKTSLVFMQKAGPAHATQTA
jgi:ribosomal protein S18 acetylase RimI-like enzyme